MFLKLQLRSRNSWSGSSNGTGDMRIATKMAVATCHFRRRQIHEERLNLLWFIFMYETMYDAIEMSKQIFV